MPDTQGAMEQRRDPFGQLVFVLAEVSFDTLKSLSDLLYTGVAAVSSVKSKRDLERLLSFDLVITTDHLLHKVAKLPNLKMFISKGRMKSALITNSFSISWKETTQNEITADKS